MWNDCGGNSLEGLSRGMVSFTLCVCVCVCVCVFRAAPEAYGSSQAKD